jgi:protease IV
MADVNQQAFPPQPPPYMYQQPRRTRWWIPVMIVAIVIVLFIMGVIAFFSVLSSIFSEEPIEVKQNSVLVIELDKPISEYNDPSLFDFFGLGDMPSHYEILQSIKKASKDDRIKGIYISSGIESMGFSKTEEFLKALDEFKKTGKFIYGYMTMGDESSYMKLLPADKIFVPAEGLLEMNGFAVTSLFLKNLLDTIGVDMHVIGFEDFKSAGEPFSRTNFSDSARLQMRTILTQRQDIFCDLVAKYRKMSKEKVLQVMASCQYNPDTLKQLGFIDELGSEADVRMLMKQAVYGKTAENNSKSKLNTIKVTDYMKSVFPEDENIDFDKQIAIIHGSGMISPTDDNNPFGGGDHIITSKKFIKYLTQAREDESIKAIILRIDSPGGSALTSDEIYQEVLKTKKVKPVYASMSDVAASGGYYIAVAADTIIANPSTITGSIGVITAIPSFNRLIKKVYLSVDTVATTPSAMTLKGVFPMSENEKVMIKSFAGGIYYRFLSKVAASRKMSVEKVRSMAKGRVWTGADAQKLGLVDVLGGMNDAVAIAKKRIGIPEGQKVVIRQFPERKESFQAFLEMFGLEDSETTVNIKVNKLAAQLGMSNNAFMQIIEMLPRELKNQVMNLSGLLEMVKTEKAVMMMPMFMSFN